MPKFGNNPNVTRQAPVPISALGNLFSIILGFGKETGVKLPSQRVWRKLSIVTDMKSTRCDLIPIPSQCEKIGGASFDGKWFAVLTVVPPKQ